MWNDIDGNNPLRRACNIKRFDWVGNEVVYLCGLETRMKKKRRKCTQVLAKIDEQMYSRVKCVEDRWVNCVKDSNDLAHDRAVWRVC